MFAAQFVCESNVSMGANTGRQESGGTLTDEIKSCLGGMGVTCMQVTTYKAHAVVKWEDTHKQVVRLQVD